MNRKYKVTEDVVLLDRPLWSDNAHQHVTEKELKIFGNYDVTRLKHLGA